MTKESLVKASGAIHISHKISLVQKKLWNYLLKHAYNDLDKKTHFSIGISDLYTLLNTRDEKNIKKILHSLNISIEFNVFGKDNLNQWESFSLLNYININNGIVTYSFGERLSELLFKPRFYALINLAIQQKISSKYSLFLYELCLDYLGLGKTGWLTIDKVRHFMGLENNEYPQFKFLNQHIIQKAIIEINEKTDLTLVPQFKYLGRKVIEVQFSITKKIELPIEPLIMNEPASIKKDALTYLPATISSEMGALVLSLKAAGIEEVAATKIVHQYDLKIIREKLKMLKISKDTIQNKTGWLLKALESNWHLAALDQQEARIEKTKEEQRSRELVDKLRKEHGLYKEKAALERYEQLPDAIRLICDEELEKLAIQQKKNPFAQFEPEDAFKITYLVNSLLNENEVDFSLWAKARGHINIESIG